MEKKPYIPKQLDIKGLKLDYNEFAPELSKAQYVLGQLQGSQKKLQNPDLLVSPLTAKEATTSSRIEGTQSDVEDLFTYEAGGEAKYADVKEVINYRKAIRSAVDEMKKDRELSVHLIKSLHGVLLKDVMHKGELGGFRKGQVWIAEKAGQPIEEALYVPPEAVQVPSLIENLIDYTNNGIEDALIKAGISHYQFEAIHPFDDGNGRMGRLLIPLILYKQGKLSSPILYLSGYFEKNRDEYIYYLHKVDETGKYEEWLKFFLKSVAEQLQETQKIIDDIYGLYDQLREDNKNTKSPYLIPFIDFLFMSPIFTIKMVMEGINSKGRQTARALIEDFQSKGLVREVGVRKKDKLFEFTPLLRIIE